MFDPQPEAEPVRLVQNHRTKSIIMIVSNWTFLKHVEAQHPAERFASVPPQPQREASHRQRFDLQAISEVILAVLLCGGAITAAVIFWP